MALFIEAVLLQKLDDRSSDMSDSRCNWNAYRFKSCNLFSSRALAAGNDGACMTHAFSWRCHASCDEACDRFLHVFMNPFGSFFFRIAADFADHEDCIRIRIFIIQLQSINEIRVLDRVTADADSTGLSDACIRQLECSFICQRAGTGNDAYMAFPEDFAWDDADIALIGHKQPRT